MLNLQSEGEDSEESLSEDESDEISEGTLNKNNFTEYERRALSSHDYDEDYYDEETSKSENEWS